MQVQQVAAEGTVTAVAQDSKTYKATFSGSAFSDAAANDSKAVVVSATDASNHQTQEQLVLETKVLLLSTNSD